MPSLPYSFLHWPAYLCSSGILLQDRAASIFSPFFEQRLSLAMVLPPSSTMMMIYPHHWPCIRAPALNWGALTSCEKFRLDSVVFYFDPQSDCNLYYTGDAHSRSFNDCPACMIPGHKQDCLFFLPFMGPLILEVMARLESTARYHKLAPDVISKCLLRRLPVLLTKAGFPCTTVANVWRCIVNKVYLTFPRDKVSMVDVSAEMVKEVRALNSSQQQVSYFAIPRDDAHICGGPPFHKCQICFNFFPPSPPAHIAPPSPCSSFLSPLNKRSMTDRPAESILPEPPAKRQSVDNHQY